MRRERARITAIARRARLAVQAPAVRIEFGPHRRSVVLDRLPRPAVVQVTGDPARQRLFHVEK